MAEDYGDSQSATKKQKKHKRHAAVEDTRQTTSNNNTESVDGAVLGGKKKKHKKNKLSDSQQDSDFVSSQDDFSMSKREKRRRSREQGAEQTGVSADDNENSFVVSSQSDTSSSKRKKRHHSKEQAAESTDAPEQSESLSKKKKKQKKSQDHVIQADASLDSNANLSQKQSETNAVKGKKSKEIIKDETAADDLKLTQSQTTEEKIIKKKKKQSKVPVADTEKEPEVKKDASKSQISGSKLPSADRETLNSKANKEHKKKDGKKAQKAAESEKLNPNVSRVVEEAVKVSETTTKQKKKKQEVAVEKQQKQTEEPQSENEFEAVPKKASKGKKSKIAEQILKTLMPEGESIVIPTRESSGSSRKRKMSESFSLLAEPEQPSADKEKEVTGEPAKKKKKTKKQVDENISLNVVVEKLPPKPVAGSLPTKSIAEALPPKPAKPEQDEEKASVSKRVKKAKKTAPELATQPIVEEPLTEKTREGNMTGAEQEKFLNRLMSILPAHDSSSHAQRLQNLDWNLVEFDGCSAEFCRQQWERISANVRKSRTLAEMIQDVQNRLLSSEEGGKEKAKSAIKEAKVTFCSAHTLYVTKKVGELLKKNPQAQREEAVKKYNSQWAKMTRAEKVDIIRETEKENIRRLELLKQKCRSDPLFKLPKRLNVLSNEEQRILDEFDGIPPKPPGSAYLLFCEIEMEKLHGKMKDTQTSEILKLVGRQWSELSEIQKELYKHQLEVKRKGYEEFLRKNPAIEKRISARRASPVRKITVKFDGEPVRPPSNGYQLFCKETLPRLVTIEQALRMKECGGIWAQLPSEKKDIFNRTAKAAFEKYQQDLQEFKANMSPENLQRYEAYKKLLAKNSKKSDENKEGKKKASKAIQVKFSEPGSNNGAAKTEVEDEDESDVESDSELENVKTPVSQPASKSPNPAKTNSSKHLESDDSDDVASDTDESESEHSDSTASS